MNAGSTAVLADFCAGLRFDDLPPAVVDTVKCVLVDAIGTSLAATTLGEGCDEWNGVVLAYGGAGDVPLLGLGQRASPLAASLVNGALAHALNFDAGGPVGHVGSIVPAPLVAAHIDGRTNGRQLIVALAAAFEVSARLAGAARMPHVSRRAVLDGQLIGYFAAAAGCGSVLGLSSEQMHSAFGLALMQAAGTSQIVLEGDPPAKSIYAGFSNHGGLLSALLARGGLRAPIAAFEGVAGLFERHYEAAATGGDVFNGLGDRYDLLATSFKLWPSSGVTHPFIEAAKDIGVVDPALVKEIRLIGSERTRPWFEPMEERRNPRTASAAANSIYYTTEQMLVHGVLGPEQFRGRAFDTPTPLRAKMVHRIGEGEDSDAVVELHFIDGRSVSKRIGAHLGSAARPISREQLIDKFFSCASYARRPLADVRGIGECILHLERVDNVAHFMSQL